MAKAGVGLRNPRRRRLRKSRERPRRDWAQWVTSLVALAALVFTGLSLQQTRWQNHIAEQGQITDRYSTAIGQLGSGNDEDVRMGGIYALARIMRDSPDDQPTIVAVLSAFVRNHPPGRADPLPDFDAYRLPADVAAALGVLGGRDRLQDDGSVEDLSGVDFANMDLSGERLVGANLRGADLEGTDLSGADLDSATVDSATVFDEDTTLEKASLVRADLIGAQVRYVNFGDADLTNAYLTGTDLTDARLRWARLSGADLRWATWTGAQVYGTALCDGSRSRYPRWQYTCQP